MTKNWALAAAAILFHTATGQARPMLPQGVVACGDVEALCFADQGDCPCDNEYPAGGCGNVTGAGGILSVTGHGVVGADELIFTARQLPAATASILFASRAPGRIPFFNGVLCMNPTGDKILRVGPPVLTSDEGVISFGPDLIALLANSYEAPSGIIAPGSTWYFQNYYRDLGHCVATANTTNAIRVEFAPPPPAGITRIGGRIFYDLDGSGAFEVGQPGEAEIEGWRVTLDNGGPSVVVHTDASGRFEFDVPMDSTAYTLRSIAPLPGYIPEVGGLWLATSPAEVTLTSNVAEHCFDFGVLFFESQPGAGHSPGFWHDQGESLLAACDPQWREVINGLCLRTNVTNANGQEGTLFTVSLEIPFDEAFNALSSYLQAPAHGVLAYTLSRQFCAANLSKNCGDLQGIIYVDRNDNGVLVSFEDMFEQTLGLLCDPCAANTGPHGDQACREAIMGCLNEWDGVNSGGGSVFAPRPTAPNFVYFN